MPDPRVSILIPNFNNGRQSSHDGRRDFVADLFKSLVETLELDPTPLEIIVADDGSTDDSLTTCREWAGKTWRNGQPFCRLLEFKHRGVLSAVANDLTRAARGEVCCRLDGDIICRTPNWAVLIGKAFDSMPNNVGVLGPKQLGLDGRIHAAGSWILHPRGRHNIAQGALPALVTRCIETDDVMGCFYCHRKAVWDDVGGYDENLLRGQTEDFSLMARLKGWRVIAVPNIEYVHAHAARKPRDNQADTAEGLSATRDAFHRKWGFDRMAADLDCVEQNYSGTPLLWNARVFGPRDQWSAMSEKPIEPQTSEWGRFINDASFRDAMRARAQIVQNIHRLVSPCQRVLHVQCRGGLLCHLLSQVGMTCTGVDPDPHRINLSQNATRSQQYPAQAPKFFIQNDASIIPAKNGSFDAVLLFDVLERHHNPVALLREANRLLAENGTLVIIARERLEPFDADYDNLHAYRPHELAQQLESLRCFLPVAAESIGSIPGAIVRVVRKCEMASEKAERSQSLMTAGRH